MGWSATRPPFPKWVYQRLVEEREQISGEASVGLWCKSASPPWPSYGSPSWAWVCPQAPDSAQEL